MGFLKYFSGVLLLVVQFSLIVREISAQCASELSVSTFNLSPQSGDFLQLSCNVSDANFERASWYQGETLLVMGVTKLVDNPRLLLPGEVDIGDGCFNFGIGIRQASTEDAGEYTCRIGNTTSTAMVIDVIVTPESTYPTCHADLTVGASADEDATVTLVCQTQTGNPPWSPSWGSMLLGGVENVSISGEITTSLLELTVTPEVLGSTFTCSAACNSSHVSCLSSDVRSCFISGLLTALPMSQRIEAGGNANYTCETSFRNHRVLWIIPEEIQMASTANTECSADNTSCNLIITNLDHARNGTQIQCALSQVGSNEIIMESSVTLLVDPESTTSTPTTAIDTVPTQQSSTTPFITPPPPPPPTPPFVATRPRPTTIGPTTVRTTTIPVTTSTTSLPSTNPSTISTAVPTTTTTTMSQTSAPDLSPTSTQTSGPVPSTSVETPTPDSGQNSSAGVSIVEIIAIVVTISIFLIVLIILFACVLFRRNASAEKRGRLRRDAAMLDSHAPSPFNAYDMQTVLGGKDAKEMSGPTEDKSGGEDTMGYLLPIPDLDAEDDDDVDNSSFDNPGFDKDSALYASIPSKSNYVNERFYHNTLPHIDDRRQNGSIDQGYYEHYPDPELGSGSRIVHGIISTTL